MNPNTGTQKVRERVVFGSTGNILEIDIAIDSVRVSIAVILSNLEKKRFMLQSIVHHPRKWWQESRGRNWSISHGGMLLPDLFRMICSACFLIAPRTTNPGMASLTVTWALPHIKTIHYRLSHGQPTRGIFLTEVHFPKMIPSYIKLASTVDPCQLDI